MKNNGHINENQDQLHLLPDFGLDRDNTRDAITNKISNATNHNTTLQNKRSTLCTVSRRNVASSYKMGRDLDNHKGIQGGEKFFCSNLS